MAVARILLGRHIAGGITEGLTSGWQGKSRRILAVGNQAEGLFYCRDSELLTSGFRCFDWLYWIDSLIALDGLAREHRPLCKYRSDGSRG
jgi:hypothetical protein